MKKQCIWILCGALVALTGCPKEAATDKAADGQKPTKPAAPDDKGTPPGQKDPHAGPGPGAPHAQTPMVRDDEPHLANLVQLTQGGENAEAYFSKDGTELTFQSKRDGLACDQIFRMGIDGQNVRQVSVGDGRTTCAYIQVDGSILYSSTHGHGEGCLWQPDHSQGYVWPIYPEMDIWRADADGKNAKVLFQSDGYDAEATVCHKDGRIIFTSTKDGDLELYTMDKDGKNVTRLTHTPGYDGGAFFSADCSKIVWRASRPTGKDLEGYQALLKQNLVRPSRLEIYVADADGGNVVQVTNNGAANFAPYLHPDNQRLVYVSNKGDPQGRNFDIYLVGVDGQGEQQITHNPTFDGFPMWSHDGKKFVFASNRHNQVRGETNIFIADWVEAKATP